MDPSTRRVALVAALAPAVWGTHYLVVAELLPPGRPLLAALLRALPAGLLLLAVGRTLPRGQWWWRSLVLGGLNIGIFFALLFVAAYRLPGGVAATLMALSPLVATGLGALLLSERARPVQVAAGVGGLVGVAMLVLDGSAGLDPLGVGAGLGSALVMALGLVLTRHWQPPVGLVASTSWQLLGGSVVLLPLTWALEGLPLASLSATNLAGYAYVAVLGTAVAYLVWFRGVQTLPVAQSSVLGLLNPVVATLVGWVVLGEVLSPRQAAGAALVLGAVVAGQLAGRVRPQRVARRRGVEVPRPLLAIPALPLSVPAPDRVPDPVSADAGLAADAVDERVVEALRAHPAGSRRAPTGSLLPVAPPPVGNGTSRPRDRTLARAAGRSRRRTSRRERWARPTA